MDQKWINGPAVQIILCAAGFTFVLLAGGANGHSNTIVSHLLFFGAIILDALVIIYYGFVAKVIALGRLGQIAHRGAAASLASLVYLVVLAMMAYELWPRHH